MTFHPIISLLEKRILVLDGAMGTMIQRYGLDESDYRGTHSSHTSRSQRGNNDLLCLTRPDVIGSIHDEYLSAGADIIETNSFNATSVSQADYDMGVNVRSINLAAARIARQSADRFSALNPDKPRFVAGSIGPTNKTLSLSADVNDPAHRDLTFDQLAASYEEQIDALIEGGVDLLLIETIFDTLNAKAALYATQQSFAKVQKELPILLSVTLADRGGRTLTGQTLDAFVASVTHLPILSIGLNCSFGARDMKPFLEELGKIASTYISAYPNAGLPNQLGEYDETPEVMAEQIRSFIDERLVNILGGCCGTTPEHIAAYQPIIAGATPRLPQSLAANNSLVLAGLERVVADSTQNFIPIGERCNVAGSRKFLRLINEKKYEEAIYIAREQVENGTTILDINMDDGLLDTKTEIVHFLNLLASEPDVARCAFMVDSSDWEVVVAGVKAIQGKPIVNSISLKEGEAIFRQRIRTIKHLGAAVVVMAFDEVGQADTYERKIGICERAYRILIDEDFPKTDIIFDPNILAIGTGIDAHADYAVDFIRATRWIKENLPGAKISGGVSNLSFSFRGNNGLRRSMHALFLYHAIAAGMDMGIVNAAESIDFESIPQELRNAIEDLLFNRRPDATERLIELAQSADYFIQTASPTEKADLTTESLSVGERLVRSLRRGETVHLEADLQEALQSYPSALSIIDGPLMDGMNEVGVLFSDGKLFLPQVVKSARVMKQAVSILRPTIEAENRKSGRTNRLGKVILATVKGDVHDIGKNILSVILTCNNFDVIDLGVMVPKEDILQAVRLHQPDFVGLSGLITPSLAEMEEVILLFAKEEIKIPVFIGGATTSRLHTALKLAPLTNTPIIHTRDASQTPGVMSQWIRTDRYDALFDSLRIEYQELRESIRIPERFSEEEAFVRRLSLPWSEYNSVFGITDQPFKQSFTIDELLPYINWKFFFSLWRLGGKCAEIPALGQCPSCRANWIDKRMADEPEKAKEAIRLYDDLCRLIRTLPGDAVHALFQLFRAHATDDGIVFIHHDKRTVLPTPRQLIKQKEGVPQLALCDFVSPHGDRVGLFGVAVTENISDSIESYRQSSDDYSALILQSFADRLAEAASECLHERVRTSIWGFAPDEKLEVSDLFSGRYQGIRPAIGYPSLPDLSLNHTVNHLLNLSQIGITLASTGAMLPQASVSGLIISHPKSCYFAL